MTIFMIYSVPSAHHTEKSEMLNRDEFNRTLIHF